VKKAIGKHIIAYLIFLSSIAHGLYLHRYIAHPPMDMILTMIGIGVIAEPKVCIRDRQEHS